MPRKKKVEKAPEVEQEQQQVVEENQMAQEPNGPTEIVEGNSFGASGVSESTYNPEEYSYGDPPQEGTLTITTDETLTKFPQTETIPPKILTRNAYGLIEGQEYKYKENGFIDWRAMVDKKYLYPNKDRAKGETDVDKLDDTQLVIKLGGLKELARIRGYKAIEFPLVNNPSPTYVSSVCKIHWLANYETEGREVVSSAVSAAHSGNVNAFMHDYLAECSENRSFCRAVRSFLGIDIVSHEELFDRAEKQKEKEQAQAAETGSDPKDLLALKMEQAGMTFEQLKDKCVKAKKHNYKNVENWSSIKDVEIEDVYVILGVLKDVIKKQQSK